MGCYSMPCAFSRTLLEQQAMVVSSSVQRLVTVYTWLQ